MTDIVLWKDLNFVNLGMKRFLLTISAVVAVVAAAADGPGAPRFVFDETDPNVHDPVMAYEDGRYYLFNTGVGIGVISSADLKTWRQERNVLDPIPEWAKTEVPAYKGHTWAPDIVRVGDWWYLYYSCSTFGKNISAIGVARAGTLNPDNPGYGWEDLGMVIGSRPGVTDWNAIDPNVILDRKGDPWMTFGSFWDGIQLVRLKKDMKTPQGDCFTIARRRRPCGGGKAQENAGENAIEAPFIVEKDGWYYLFVSHDYCCKGLESNYRTVVGRSRSIEGPYLDRDRRDMAHGGGTLVIGPDEKYSGVGHCSVYEFGGRWIFAAHGYDKAKNGASKLVVRFISWDDEGWPELDTL